MDELKQLMGDSFKDDMTLEDVSAFLKGKNFKDLSTGNYVDKSKFDSRVNELTQQLNEKTNALNSKLTDEEKIKNASAEQAKEIERLKKLLSENTITGNKNTVNSIMSATRELLGIDSSDSDFTSLIDNITTEDTTKSSNVANYIAKIVKDSYEKGKNDATKNAMGDMGKKGKGQGSGEGNNDDIGEIGQRLANSIKKSNGNDFSYFN